MEILLVTEGALLLDQLSLKAGDSAVMEAEAALKLVAQQPSVLFRSFVPN